MIERNYESALSYLKKKNDAKFGRGNERLERNERTGKQDIRDGSPITMHEMARASDVIVRSHSTARFASSRVERFKVSIIKIYLTLERGIGAERARSVPDTEVCLMFVKSESLIERYIPTKRGEAD